MKFAIYNYIETWIMVLLEGLTWNTSSLVMQSLANLLPLILIPFFITTLIAIATLVFSILSYRNTKKILKKLNETENGRL